MTPERMLQILDDAIRHHHNSRSLARNQETEIKQRNMANALERLKSLYLAEMEKEQ